MSPVPNLRLLPKSEREETTDAKDFELEVPHVDILPTSRCFHPDMHAAEETISRELARLAAAPPKIVRHNISQWIKKNEAGGGKHTSHLDSIRDLPKTWSSGNLYRIVQHALTP